MVVNPIGYLTLDTCSHEQHTHFTLANDIIYKTEPTVALREGYSIYRNRGQLLLDTS